jgi:hypothetical protein
MIFLVLEVLIFHLFGKYSSIQTLCCPFLPLDPILWLPMSYSERSICVRWRLNWLPGAN